RPGDSEGAVRVARGPAHLPAAGGAPIFWNALLPVSPKACFISSVSVPSSCLPPHRNEIAPFFPFRLRSRAAVAAARWLRLHAHAPRLQHPGYPRRSPRRHVGADRSRRGQRARRPAEVAEL